MMEEETVTDRKAKKTLAWRVVHILVLALFAAAVETFLVFCLAFFREKWAEWLYILALAGGSALNLALLTVDFVFYFLRKELVYKACITAYVTVLVFFAIAYLLLATGFLEVFRDEESLQNYLERSGKWMSALFTTLQFLQVVILPIPSTVTVVAGAALFGPLWGSIYSLIGIVVGSLVAFLIGRIAGSKVVAWLVGQETLDKWLAKIKGKDKLLLTAMFLLPVFPDDVLCFVAGLSSMSVWYFLAVIAISRVLAIFTTSYSITLIPFNTWWGILVWIVIFLCVAALLVVLYKKSDAILGWFEKKFRRGTRRDEREKESAKEEFCIQVVDPDGSLVTKSVPQGDPPEEGREKK